MTTGARIKFATIREWTDLVENNLIISSYATTLIPIISMRNHLYCLVILYLLYLLVLTVYLDLH